MCSFSVSFLRSFFFFFNDTATTEIYTLSLHDALPICPRRERIARDRIARRAQARAGAPDRAGVDRKSTRLNSSHSQISYAVFCLKKKKKKIKIKHAAKQKPTADTTIITYQTCAPISTN